MEYVFKLFSEVLMPFNPIVLGIESSCDETAAAVVGLKDGIPTILGESLYSQVKEHAPYGGVVPEIAARAHVDVADIVVKKAMEQADLTFDGLDAVAATSGPGLIGGVMVGTMTGKAIAMASEKPFIPINHLEGHALSPRLTENCPFPYLLLLVSGGHCQFIAVHKLGKYQKLGTTIDDAVGETFDKIARSLGLGFPGGPAVERCALSGNSKTIKLPIPLLGQDSLDMSFAGLKTAVLRVIDTEPLNEGRIADICASFQNVVTEVLVEKSRRSIEKFRSCVSTEVRFVVAGGVAANLNIRDSLDKLAESCEAKLIAPPLRYCTDNAAMIALAGAERYYSSRYNENGLSFKTRSRWPLDEEAALNNPTYGSGKQGAKI